MLQEEEAFSQSLCVTEEQSDWLSRHGGLTQVAYSARQNLL